jgi:CO dehydrogenase maturation factor
LLSELDTRVGRRYLIINRARQELSPAITRQIETEGLDLLSVLPDDDIVRNLDEDGQPVYDVSPESPFYRSTTQFLSKLLPDL